MTLGDSKTASGAWTKALAAALPLPSGSRWVLYDAGVSGSTVASSAASIATLIATMEVTSDPTVEVLTNWGANDVNVLPVEATWKANYLTIIDAVSAKWTQAKVRITKPWRRGYAASCNTLATWIDDIVATRPGVAFVGDDERVWLENGDDGATRSTDGIHYSAAGQAVAPVVKATAMGY